MAATWARHAGSKKPRIKRSQMAEGPAGEGGQAGMEGPGRDDSDNNRYLLIRSSPFYFSLFCIVNRARQEDKHGMFFL
ncbi:hypothetical protein ACOMHN_046389 [Nucella lapillus]